MSYQFYTKNTKQNYQKIQTINLLNQYKQFVSMYPDNCNDTILNDIRLKIKQLENIVINYKFVNLPN